MDEYIERNKIRESYEKLTRSYVNGDPYIADWQFDEMIESLPVADVAPVRHGQWKYNTDFQVWNCSECGENPHKGTGVVVVEKNLPAYCPHCGVRMDGRRLEGKENETEELG